MARIAFAIEHEEGHLFPTFKLARRLMARGHRVAYFGISDAREAVASQGLEFQPILEKTLPEGAVPILRRAAEDDMSPSGKRGWMALYEAYLVGLARGEADRPIRAFRPDIFVTSSFHGAVTLGLYYRYRLPIVLLTPYLRRTPKSEFAPQIQDVLGRLTSGIDELMALVRLVNPAARRLGDVVSPFLRMRELILCPAALEVPGMSYEHEREVFYVEPSVDLERLPEGEFPWERIDPARRLVYCAFGSQMRAHPREGMLALVGSLIEAARQHPDWQLVLSSGGACAAADLPPLPGNALVVDWAPQLALLQRAAAAVVHGGLGTTKECILLGVPMIVCPQVNDQLDNAERVACHRLGLRSRGDDLTPAGIGALVRTAMECPEIRTSLGRMREHFHQMEKEAPSVARIEEVILGRRTAPG